MSDNMLGRKALILGGGGGMGRAVATLLCQKGATCILSGRHSEKLEEACSEIRKAGGHAQPLELDIGNIAQIEAATQSCIDILGGIDYLINCAGIHVSAKAHEADLAAWDQMLNINFRGFAHIVRHTLPEINKSQAGAVVVIGSITLAYSGSGMHMAVKRAIVGFCEALFEDVREFGTKICVINPGYVNTPMVRSGKLDRSKMIQPRDIAEIVLFVLQSPETMCPTEITVRPQKTPLL